MEYTCKYYKPYCLYNPFAEAKGDEDCDKGCQYLEVKETKASASNSTGLVCAPPTTKDHLKRFAAQQYVTMRRVNFSIPDEVLDWFNDVIKDAINRCA